MANFGDAAFRGAMLLVLNGEGGQPSVVCANCRRPLLRVFVTERVRQIDPTMPTHQDVCITAKWLGPIPCPKAIEAKGLIDRLMDASRW